MAVDIRLSAVRPSFLFQTGFTVAALVAVFATFVAISGVGPGTPPIGVMVAILAANLVLILSLAVLLVRRYRAVRRDRQGGRKLAQRFVFLFSIAAVLPATVVAIFLGLTLARGLDYWFSNKVQTTVEETAEFADSINNQIVQRLEYSVRDVASGLNQPGARDALINNPEQYEAYLRGQAVRRDLLSIYVIDGRGNRLAGWSRTNGPYVAPATEAFTTASSGEVDLRLFDDTADGSGIIRALFPLEPYDDAYVYLVTRSFSPSQLANLRRVEGVVADYRETLRRSSEIGLLFAIGYGQIVALILLLSARLGLEAAARITGPIGRLAGAASDVRAGDLNVRVPIPEADDEITTLTRAFNDMTGQLSAQRADLVAARQDAEDRRAFLEAVLSDVSAGVIRTDANLVITIANRAATQLLGLEGNLTGMALAEVAPDFLECARASADNLVQSDISLDIRHGDITRTVRLKTSPDETGGCVLTFDDTTRLVMAQRQLAWRDVARRIAHEIRNPLTPIQLSTERLRRRYRATIAEDDTAFDTCIDTILRQVEDIGRMVEEFSSFARMPKPVLGRFDLVALARRVAYAQRMVWPDAVIDVEASDEVMWTEGDERLLGQALTNLIKNAAEAVSRCAETDDTAARINVSIARNESRILIEIEDTGQGFPEAGRNRLLEPYVTEREGGTGLGLAIVSRIVSDHGGVLSLNNRRDQRRGARVTVELPNHSAHDPHPDSAAPEKAEERV